jgi:hemerythrin-like domain-containing protein
MAMMHLLELLMPDPAATLPRTGNDPVSVLHEEHMLMLDVVDAMETESRHLLTGLPVRAEFWTRAVEFLEHFLDRLHHEKEEQLLFPVLEHLGFGHDHGPLPALRSEHLEGRRMVRGILSALNDRDSERLAHTCLGFCRRERQHIEREESMLLPLAREALQGEALQQLRTAFDAHRDTIDPTIYLRCLAISRHLGRELGAETFAL